jgi:hypothetical protein
MCAGSERDILVPQRGHLGQSKAGLNGGEQKGVVPASQPLRSIRRRHQRLDLGPGKKAPSAVGLARNQIYFGLGLVQSYLIGGDVW